MFDDILRLATLICDTPMGKIGFVDQERVWLKAKIGFEFDEIPRERSFSAHALLRSDILIVPDPLADARVHEHRVPVIRGEVSRFSPQHHGQIEVP